LVRRTKSEKVAGLEKHKQMKRAKKMARKERKKVQLPKKLRKGKK
jgi:hypothetical protein